MKIQQKVVFILSLMLLIVFSILFYLKTSEKKHLNLLLENVREERNVSLDKLLTLHRQGLRAFATNYTYWDELVEFIQNPDPVWGDENIQISLPDFNLDGGWIYNADFQPVYSVFNAPDGTESSFRFSSEDLKRIFSSNKRFVHFFMKAPEGILEIQGASVHPTDDPTRKTDPRGYLLVGRLWTNSLMKDIGKLTDGIVSLRLPQTQSEKSMPALGYATLLLSRDLRGWNNEIVAHLDILTRVPFLRAYYLAVNREFRILIVILTAACLLQIFLFMRWVSIPLGRLSKALRVRDSAPILSMTKDSSEFGQVAQLTLDSFEYEKNLIAEIDQRKKAQQDKEKVIQELQFALTNIRTLSGLLPICSACKKIRDDKGYWKQIESYIKDHSGADFSHGICPECAKKLYPEIS